MFDFSLEQACVLRLPRVQPEHFLGSDGDSFDDARLLRRATLKKKLVTKDAVRKCTSRPLDLSQLYFSDIVPILVFRS